MPALLVTCLFVLLNWEGAASQKTQDPIGRLRCYSCASDNMKENFLTRSRGPSGRMQEPTLYDSMCDLDTWMIKEKSAEECDGPCFKWQQILNNSGVYSYSTIRGCYSRMFGNNRPPGSAAHRLEDPFHSDCTTKEKVLECIDQSTLIEHLCICRGDFCNGKPSFKPYIIASWAIALILPALIFRRN